VYFRAVQKENVQVARLEEEAQLRFYTAYLVLKHKLVLNEDGHPGTMKKRRALTTECFQ
jgi:hypothetical protein